MSQNDPGNQGRSEEDADDVRLMQLVGDGDTQALEQLIEKHQTLVAGTVARMLLAETHSQPGIHTEL